MKKPAFLLSSFLLLTGCSKERNHYKTEVENPEIRLGATLKEGSYFVYKDSISGILDSFWVYSFSTGYSGQAYHEYIESYLKDNLENKLVISASRMLTSLPILFGFINGSATQLTFFPFEGTGKVFNAKALNHYSNFNVNGNNYENVYEVVSLDTEINSMGLTDTTEVFHSYYSPEHGLVKFYYYASYNQTALNNRTWELIRSKIIR